MQSQLSSLQPPTKPSGGENGENSGEANAEYQSQLNAYNEQKSGWMPVDERLAAISRLYADEPRVKVVSYTGLTADFAKENGVTAIVRGVRTMADYDYEMQMADVNRQLTGIETVFLPASPQLASLSSSLLRELSHFGHDISAFLPKY